MTKAKINKLRRSYDGKIKQLEISGKNKSVKQPGELASIMDFPDEEWYNQKVFGKEVTQGLSDEVKTKLERSLNMLPGKLPSAEREKWEDFVNLDDAAKAKTSTTAGQKKPQQAASAKLGIPALPRRPSIALSPADRIARPERTGKKRRYDDNSFEGYGDGFVDDADRSGYSTPFAEEDSRAMTAKKKRRRVGP